MSNRDSKGRFCKAKLDGVIVTQGPQWLKFRKNPTDMKLSEGHYGTIVGEPFNNGKVYVRWDGMGQTPTEVDFYILGREVVIASHDTATSSGKPAAKPEPTIAPGAVVRLKSGGPEMTVEQNVNECLCVWFHGNVKHSTLFNPVLLEVVR